MKKPVVCAFEIKSYFRRFTTNKTFKRHGIS